VNNEFILSNSARSDILALWEYIAESAGKRTADRFRKKIFKALDFLAEMPHAGHRREDLTLLDVKFWTVGDYAIIYDPLSVPLYVVRVMHWSRDLSYLLH